ncbi:hypothetical protein SAMN05421640_0831 [Ekhidna lutea]|uniref:Uncharacterized protein n=1 Tax=Ekhidna lutea TaxID=447679 RepID=A0A239FWZ4_EKHLU|nr:hypothetical protein [Ekhidna lutea]SNS60344.1 hypothetical protein SAMN05421640_0831 [Ekhidna lutea]
MSNKELSKDESLALITDMISQAKRNVAKGGSFYFLLWGWVVMFANLGHYLIAKFDWLDYPYIVWTLTIPAVIASIVYGAKKSKEKVKSHLDRLYSQIWLAVFIGVIIILFFMGNVNYNVNAIILTFAGIGTFISGRALRFQPLVAGGIALWISSIVAFNLHPIDQYLVGAVGILAGYLIPGYLLRKAEK